MRTASVQHSWLWRAATAAILAGFGALATLSLAACNTVEGAGKDIEAAGEGIQDAAD